MSCDNGTTIVLTVLVAFFVHASECNSSCATWLYLSQEGQCTCGSSLLNKIICNNVSQTVSIQNSFCLTSFNRHQYPHDPVIGRCLYVLNHGKYIYWWRFWTLLWSRSEPYPARSPTLWLPQSWRKAVWSLQREPLHLSIFLWHEVLSVSQRTAC